MTTQPTTGAPFVTLEELAKLPERPRYELVAGVLVKLPDAESGVHENTAAIVMTHVANHVYPNNLGAVLSSNYGYVTVKAPPSTCRNADVSFISSARLHQRDLHGMFFDVVTGSRKHKPRKHTIIVKPAEKVSVDVTADAVGDWAFHCHLLYHMHAGMFQVVSVLEGTPKSHS